jgi:hypothetical protein
MTYGVDDTAPGAEPPAAAMGAPTTAKPPPGWYPDPGDSSHHRFWNGEVWTADRFPNGPASAWIPPSGPPPPAWTPPIDPTTPVPVLADLQPEPSPGRSGRAVVAIAVVVGLIVGFLGAVTVHFAFGRNSSNATAPVTAPVTAPAVTAPSGTAPSLVTPSTTAPSATTPIDPAQSVLSSLGISQADVTAGFVVQAIQGGRQVGAGEPTLDLCNGNFPSESLRTSRLQVAEADAQSTVSLSTEAVMYANPAATAQAFAELKTTAASCPSTPVSSPVGGSAVTTHFNAAPDTAWPQTPAVERLAFDFVATDETGQSQHFVSAYLRRGRILVGVYFAHPDGAQPAIQGQTTVAGIVDLVAKRIAQLPASVVNGG